MPPTVSQGEHAGGVVFHNVHISSLWVKTAKPGTSSSIGGHEDARIVSGHIGHAPVAEGYSEANTSLESRHMSFHRFASASDHERVPLDPSAALY